MKISKDLRKLSTKLGNSNINKIIYLWFFTSITNSSINFRPSRVHPINQFAQRGEVRSPSKCSSPSKLCVL